MRLYLVRHGETEYNRRRIMQGHSEEPLNDAGIRQCALLARRLEGEGIATIYSSDIRRAAMTAGIVAAFTGAPIEYEPLLRERDPGELTHLPYENSVPFFLDPEYRPPGGESAGEFDARVERAFARLVEIERSRSEAPRRVAVVTHGMVCGSFIRAVARHPVAGGADLRWRNTSVTVAEFDGAWRILSLSDASHLDGHDFDPAPSPLSGIVAAGAVGEGTGG